MQKQVGSIILVAGTCIGSGMIALPMLLAKIGIIPSILLMMLMWLVIYFTSLVNVELNLQAGTGLALGRLGKKFSGKIAEFIGTGSFKLLSYSLLAVYIYGSSSVLQKMLESGSSENYSFISIASLYSIIAIFVLLLPLKLMDYINRILFISLLAVVAILIAGLTSMLNWSNLPLFVQNYDNFSVWRSIIPVMFTAFGFQVIFHTLTNYCHNNVKILKRAFFWGSLIPALVYIIWTCSILGSIYQNNPQFYDQMIAGKIEVGDLIKELSNIAKWSFIQTLVWWISLLAIVTSVLGVGLGMCDSIKTMLPLSIKNAAIRNILASIATIFPAYLIATLVPNAFISVLGFAGMILVIIAILMPIYLLSKLKTTKFNYNELNKKHLCILSVLAGFTIIICEILNML